MSKILKVRKKPIEVEAMLWDGSPESTIDILGWMGERSLAATAGIPTQLVIQTLEGPLNASVGDYIIKGVEGEFYPCKPTVFVTSYEMVEQPRELQEWVDSYDGRNRIKVGDTVTRGWGYHRGTPYGTVTRIWQPKPGSRWRLEIKPDKGQTETWQYASDCKVVEK